MRSLSLMCLLLTACGGSDPAPETIDRATLEPVLIAARDALVAGDRARIEPSVSSRLFGELANWRASLVRDDWKVLASQAGLASVVDTMTFVRAVRKGSTAGLVYRKAQTQRDGTYVAFLLARFVNEGGRWRLDRLQLPMLEQTPGTTVTFAGDPALGQALAVDGTIAPAAPRLPRAHAPGWLRVVARGHRVTLRVNGVPQRPVADDIVRNRILGGLRQGANTVELTLTTVASPRKGREPFALEVLRGDQKTTSVARWTAPAGTATHTVELTID